MDIENIVKNKNFTANIYNGIPPYLRAFFSKDEIKSEYYFTLVICSKSFDPHKGSLKNYVLRSLTNNLMNRHREQQYINSFEKPMEHAESLSYTPKYEDENLLTYLKGLPEPFVNQLTEFALGKIKEDDIRKYPDCSYDHSVVGRIIDKIDSHL